MKTSIVFLGLLAVVFGNQVFTGSGGKSLMYSITDVTLSWIDAMKVNSFPIPLLLLQKMTFCLQAYDIILY